MNLKKLLGLMLFASIFAGNVHAQQPYGACWHPEDIKNWQRQMCIRDRMQNSIVVP